MDIWGFLNTEITWGFVATVVAIVYTARRLSGWLRARRERARVQEAELARERTERSAHEDYLRNLDEEDFEDFDKVKKLREEKAEADFKRNLESTFVIQHLALEDVAFFDDCEWHFRPGVNVLLGRNGYGKSLILRMLAALVQRDDEHSKDLVGGPSSRLELQLLRDGEEKTIRRTGERFAESVGKVPLLAVPDSRFLNRAELVIGPSGDQFENLREYGAHHFLNSLPYGGIVNSLLYELCLDYWEHGRSFDLPGFVFLQDVVARLARDRFEFASIERAGRESFEIKVLTEGSETPFHIQKASQGTLSVLSTFGLMRSYLRAVYGDVDDLHERPAVVILDEADAHLHPKWQQKLTQLLRESFPHVQFFISAHSPLLVAGCLEREVAVLKRTASGFAVEQLERDFVGASARELYEVFDITELDPSVERFASWKPVDEAAKRQLRYLEERHDAGELEGAEVLERERLIRRNRVRRKVAEVVDDRHEDRHEVLRLHAEIERLRAQVEKLGSTPPEAPEETGRGS